ncbi:MAG TPA: DNA/RNA nuclease SfsA [Geminocystis sp. M7585_C2015_104]|nr:DNA/RNA nuclease SfsA [Geminocystis sp. M7585_C2015_104]
MSGVLLRRYKRFLADVRLESGEVVTAHCANTGPMLGVCEVGSRVMVSLSNSSKRKLPYTWEMIEVNGTWVGVNTTLPNNIVKMALQRKLIPELAHQYTQVKSEVRLGNQSSTRIDFCLTKEQEPPIYLEVKNTTLAERGVAFFPDATTGRGQKHLQELIALTQSRQAKAVMLYFINRGDCKYFDVGRKYDPVYGQLFQQARECGVEILPCRFQVTPEGVRYLGLAEIVS